eukprot:jgi/Hompol1/5270/HPOL_004292-RA
MINLPTTLLHRPQTILPLHLHLNLHFNLIQRPKSMLRYSTKLPHKRSDARRKLLTETLNGKTREYFFVPVDQNSLHRSGRPQKPPTTGSRFDLKQRLTTDSHMLGAAATAAAQHRQLAFKWLSPVSSTKGAAAKTPKWAAPIVRWLREMFLPVGYPSSVHKCYAQIHIWLFLESMAGSAISVLTAQAMLTSVGAAASAHESAALAIAIDWALKDGFGEVGKMLIVQQFAHQFDAFPKRWKLLGEGCSVIGAFMQLCTCIAPPGMFLFFASIGVGLRSIHFSVWSATHTTFTRNLASYNGINVGDIVAKADSQMSLAHILGMVAGIAMLSISFAPAFLFQCFAFLAASQVALTCLLVQTAKFEVLDQTRLLLLPREFIRHGRVPSLAEITPFENWLNEGLKSSETIPSVRFGTTVASAFAYSDVEHALKVLEHEKYLIGFHLSSNALEPPRYDIVLREGVDTNSVIMSALHVMRMDYELAELRRTDMPAMPITQQDAEYALEKTYEWTRDTFKMYHDGLTEREWKTDFIIWGDSGVRAEWGSQAADNDKVE